MLIVLKLIIELTWGTLITAALRMYTSIIKSAITYGVSV
jgi:hypothetical protein